MKRLINVVVQVVLLCTASFAQAQFAGRWHTPGVNKATGQHSIAVKISEDREGFSGMVVFANPDSSETTSPILNAKMADGKLEFESLLGNDTFYWTLSLKAQNRAFLHGSMREMVIDERMVKSK